jgi:cytoskeletal protein RodZ
LFRFALRIALLFAIGIIIVFSVVWAANSATKTYGQIFVPSPETTPVPSSSSSSSLPSLPSLPSSQSNITTTAQGNTTAPAPFVAHGVRITSPAKGQQVPIGTLTVTGISKDNPTIDCHVFVIVNSVKPYQNAAVAGPGGASDYSKWNFMVTSKYTLIKEGVNRITAKFSCRSNPDVASFYSVNATGTRVLVGARG